jgi:anti-anti-sigma regulatory factor
MMTYLLYSFILSRAHRNRDVLAHIAIVMSKANLRRYSVLCRNTFHDSLPNVLGVATASFRIRLKNKVTTFGPALALTISSGGTSMLSIRVENLSDLAIIECKGRIVRSESVFKLRDVVQEQADARVIALDLSAVEAIGGGGLGMLAVLDRWARDHDIQLKLFSPSRSVVDGLVHNRLMPNVEIATFHEMMDLVADADSRYSVAA